MTARSQEPVLHGLYRTHGRAIQLQWPIRLFLVVCLLLLATSGTWFLIRPGLDHQVDVIPRTVRHLLGVQRQPYTPIARISPLMQHAIVAVEDRRFYQHHGVDLHGMTRALVDDIRNRSLSEGGATLTVQLVERTVPLPANPALRAFDILGLTWVAEDDFSKEQILEMYLNDVYYGRGCYGIAAAAHRYFHVSPARLSLGQAAFLAALPQSPSYFGQHPYSGVVQGRRRMVIRDMAQQGYITAAQAKAALSAGFRVAF